MVGLSGLVNSINLVSGNGSTTDAYARGVVHDIDVSGDDTRAVVAYASGVADVVDLTTGTVEIELDHGGRNMEIRRMVELRLDRNRCQRTSR